MLVAVFARACHGAHMHACGSILGAMLAFGYRSYFVLWVPRVGDSRDQTATWLQPLIVCQCRCGVTETLGLQMGSANRLLIIR